MTEKETIPLPSEGGQLPTSAEAPSSDDRLWAGLSYITQVIVPVIIPAILLLSETNKQRAFQKYHTVHSLTLLAVTVLYELIAIVVYSILSALSMGCLACILWPILLLPVVVFVYYAYLAYQGQYFEVPYLTKFLREQHWL